jgi:hypothetical protein
MFQTPKIEDKGDIFQNRAGLIVFLTWTFLTKNNGKLSSIQNTNRRSNCPSRKNDRFQSGEVHEQIKPEKEDEYGKY